MADLSPNLFRQVDGPIIVSGTTVQAYGSTGTVMAAGSLPPATSVVGLTSSKITLQLGAPDLGPAIQFTEEGIKMTFGPPGVGSSIVMNAEGITLKVGPATTLQLQASGITIQTTRVQVEATAQYELTAGMVTESVSGTAARTAALLQFQ